MFYTQNLPFFLAFIAALSSPSPAVYAHTLVLASRDDSGPYTFSGVPGSFSHRTYIDFTTATAGSNATAFLSNNWLQINDYPVTDTPLSHTYSVDNVALSTVNGSTALDLKTSAYTSGNVICAEVATNFTFKHASVRTVLMSSSTPGIVEGNFFYLSDTQETDFEILTTTALNASEDVPAGIWATNQATKAGGTKTNVTVPFSFDPSADFHEYRIDWISDATIFYIDGSQVAELTTNVPSEVGAWIWNVWSSGDPTWSAGPPTSDAHTYIKTIEMYTGYSAASHLQDRTWLNLALLVIPVFSYFLLC